MALAQRNDIDAASDSLARHGVADHRYEAGGQVARLQAELAQRLAGQHTLPVFVPSPAERMIRLVSMAGGYASLTAGYVAAAVAIARWV